MKSKNIKPALIASAGYLAATVGATAIMAWINSELSADGTIGFINAAYITILAVGLVITFACGYAYHPLMSQSTLRYVQDNPDVPEDLVRPICKGRLLGRCLGIVSAFCLVSAALTFALSTDAHIEIICLLMGSGFMGLLVGLNYRFQSRQLHRQRFRLAA
ncbi:MAG: hypothetical protein K2L00_00885 [Muribaculaceae bacterium]|nr:hypothetical protein [Muribaculaceae bacterium]